MFRILGVVLCLVCLGQVEVGAEDGASSQSKADDATDPWLLTKADMQYAGAFKLPAGKAGKGKNCTFAFSPGPIAYDAKRDSFFVAGHNYMRGVAEISNPGLTETTELTELTRARYRQDFRNLIDQTSSGNPEKLNVIGGLYVEKDDLLFTAYNYYDAPAKVQDVFAVLRGAGDLADAKIDGFYQTGYGAHSAGWVSPIPTEFQDALKGTHIMAGGQSQSIASRYPLRPTAFSFNGSDVFGNKDFQGPLKVTPLIDGSLKYPLPEAMWNKALDEAHYAIIVPGTRTYIAFGFRGGMFSKIGYKIRTDDGRLAGGYAAQDDDDHYLYYWMYKVDDMIRAAKGEVKPHQVIPYEHGMLPLPFMQPDKGGRLGGGSWDPKTRTVYLTLKGVDRASRYTVLPVVVGMKFERYAGKDTTAPYGAMTKPNNGKKVSGQAVIEAHAIDNVDAGDDLRVQFTVDGKDYGPPATEFPYRTEWDTTTFQNGPHKLSAVATDKAQNSRQLDTITVTIEN